MRALALRLEGPLQSWGGPVAGDDRPTLDVPTRSGVIGLLGAALGVARTDVPALVALDTALAMIVRVDRVGERSIDFHTTEAVPTAEGKVRAHPVVSRRGYLGDASFAVWLVERRPVPTSLEELRLALMRPRFPLYLGRRSCVPSARVLASTEVQEGTLEELLARLPVAHRPGDPVPERLLVYVDAELAPARHHRAQRVRDVVTGPLPRLFGERVVHVIEWAPAATPKAEETVDPWF